MHNSHRLASGLVAAILFAACSGSGGCSSDDPRPHTSDCQECSVNAAARDFEDCFEVCYAGCDDLLVSDSCAPQLPAAEECEQGDSSARPHACACHDCVSCIEECDACPGDGHCLAKLTEEGTPADTDEGRCGPPSLFGVECSDGTYLAERSWAITPLLLPLSDPADSSALRTLRARSASSHFVAPMK